MDPRLERLQREIASALAGLLPDGLLATRAREVVPRRNPGTSISDLHRNNQGVWTCRGRRKAASNGSYMEAARPGVGCRRFRLYAAWQESAAGRPSSRSSFGESAGQRLGQRSQPWMRLCRAAKQSSDRAARFWIIPFLGPLSIDQWRKFHLVHGLHHVKQIRRLRSEFGNGSAKPDRAQKQKERWSITPALDFNSGIFLLIHRGQSWARQLSARLPECRQVSAWPRPETFAFGDLLLVLRVLFVPVGRITQSDCRHRRTWQPRESGIRVVLRRARASANQLVAFAS